MKKQYTVVIEKDEDGVFIGRVPEIQGCLSQGDTLDELMINIKEAIELCLEAEKGKKTEISRFVGIQQVEVA